MHLADSTLITALVAMLAAIVSMLGLVISKEVKVSEFRQAWIDSLREEIASLIAYAYAAETAFRLAQNEPDAQKKWDLCHPTYRPLNEMIARIKLRLNPKESDQILDALDRLETALNPGGSPPKPGVISAIDSTLIMETQKVLKGAWLVVREGERFYRGARVGAITLICLFALLFVYVLVRPQKAVAPGLTTIVAPP